MPGGKPAVSLPIFLLGHFFCVAHGIVERCSHQVFQHVLVIGQQARVDGHAAHIVFASHEDLDHAGTRLAFDFDVGQFVLGLFQVVLHGLGLFHQARELSFVEHGISFDFSCLRGKVQITCKLPGTMRAPKSRTMVCTSGSFSINS